MIRFVLYYFFQEPYEKQVQRCECGRSLQLDHFNGGVKEGNVWKRYYEFLPYDTVDEVSLGESDTPLTYADKLSDEYGIYGQHGG